MEGLLIDTTDESAIIKIPKSETNQQLYQYKVSEEDYFVFVKLWHHTTGLSLGNTIRFEFINEHTNEIRIL